MNTLQRSCLTLALILPLVCMPAEAAAPRGLRGGFSSQKAVPTSVQPSTNRFGGFGSAKATAPQGPRKSAMTADLDQKAAQERANRTWDARQPAPSTLPPARPAPLPAPAPVVVHQPVIVQQRSSGWGGAFLGFMLGSALSHHAVAAPQPVVVQNDTRGLITPDGQTATAATATQTPLQAAAPVETGIGTLILRVLAWSTLLGLSVWGVRAFIRKWRRLSAAEQSNYSLKGL